MDSDRAPKKRIGEILLEKGLITQWILEGALKEQRRTGEFLGQILIKHGNIKEKDLLEVLSQQFNIPIISMGDKYIDWNLVKSFSPTLILDHKYFPVKMDDFSVTFAIINPFDAWALKKAEEESRELRVKRVLVSDEDFAEVIKRYRQHMRSGTLDIFER